MLCDEFMVMVKLWVYCAVYFGSGRERLFDLLCLAKGMVGGRGRDMCCFFVVFL